MVGYGGADYNDVDWLSCATAMEKEFGAIVIDFRKYFISLGVKECGTTMTADDNIQLADGNIPWSFLVADRVHPNELGTELMSKVLYNKFSELNLLAQKNVLMGYVTNGELTAPSGSVSNIIVSANISLTIGGVTHTTTSNTRGLFIITDINEGVATLDITASGYAAYSSQIDIKKFCTIANIPLITG